MDPLTHSLVGLASAKAGLERLSPYATTVCLLAANAPDSDIVIAFTADRWTYLQHHRGITHAIVGTLALAVLIPSLFYAGDWAIAKLRRRLPRSNYRGLLVASLLVTATHPLMDWTNNYGVRPLLPWSGKWFYGDLVFIVDPYLWLIVGGAAFLVTSHRWPRIVIWFVLGAVLTFIVLGTSSQRVASQNALMVVRVTWVVALLGIVCTRVLGFGKARGRSIVQVALILVVLYWGALGWAHHLAYREAVEVATQAAAQYGERLIRAAAMPTPVNPFRWLCVAETDRATYRFLVDLGDGALRAHPAAAGNQTSAPALGRYEKPSGRTEQLVSSAAQDPRARILLGFARFPFARVENENCIDRTLVQFLDLRYTEPGAAPGGIFQIEVPVECPTRD